MRACKNCGKMINDNRRNYCSDDCKDIWADRQYEIKKSIVKERQPLKNHRCETCDRPLFSRGMRWCSDSCKLRADPKHKYSCDSWHTTEILRKHPEIRKSLDELKAKWKGLHGHPE